LRAEVDWRPADRGMLETHATGTDSGSTAS
jgi:hypothetical protein